MSEKSKTFGLSPEKIVEMKAQQREYFHWMGEVGYF